MGARTVTVTPTERAHKASDPKLSAKGWVQIRVGTCDVSQIVRSSPYQSPQLSQSEEYRLVLGTYHVVPTDFMKTVEKDPQPKDYKFRALLKLNPFTKRYTYQTANWGDPQNDESHNVE
jgi:hypothetical protein